MDDTDFVVQSLDEAQRDFVLRLTVSGDPIPMTLDHLSELLVRFEPLPLETCAPVFKEASRPRLAFITPQLAEGFFEKIGSVQPLIGRQQAFERATPFQSEIDPTREQGVLLPLDVAAPFARQARVVALSELVEHLVQMARDVKLVEQDRRLRRLGLSGIAKGLPHVHYRQADAAVLVLCQSCKELLHARLRAIAPAEPNRAASQQIAHHDAVGMALADGDLVNADHFRCGITRFGKLRGHVLLVQLFHRVPVELQFRRHLLDARLPAAPSDVVGKALGVEGIVGQKLQAFALHFAAVAAENAPHFECQPDAHVPARQVAHAPGSAIVEARVRSATGSTDCFFERRVRRMTRALGSPNTPRRRAWGQKPAKRYASSRTFGLVEVGMGSSCQLSASRQWPAKPVPARRLAIYHLSSYPHSSAKTRFLKLSFPASIGCAVVVCSSGCSLWQTAWLPKTLADMMDIESKHSPGRSKREISFIQQWVKEYGVAIGATFLAFLLRLSLDSYLNDRLAHAPFLVAIAVTTWYGGIGSSLLAVLLGGLIANWVFLHPRYAFNFTDLEDQAGIAVYLTVSFALVGFAQTWRWAWKRTEEMTRELRMEMDRHRQTEDEPARFESTDSTHATQGKQEL